MIVDCPDARFSKVPPSAHSASPPSRSPAVRPGCAPRREASITRRLPSPTRASLSARRSSTGPATPQRCRCFRNFETTGITVNVETMPYENSREKQVLDFTGGTGLYDVVLIDVVWVGEFAASQWVTPMSTFIDNPALSDPALNLEGFFPILLESFGTWDDVLYGLPFDNYSGVMYYNTAMLADAGFEAPPDTWQDLKDVYGPALTSGDQYAYALQSRRGETQSADSFMRVVWAFGGSLLNPETFEPNLSSPESMAGLQYRQDLSAIMPPDVVEWDHDETVQGLAQGRVGVITEWTGFYETLADPRRPPFPTASAWRSSRKGREDTSQRLAASRWASIRRARRRSKRLPGSSFNG